MGEPTASTSLAGPGASGALQAGPDISREGRRLSPQGWSRQGCARMNSSAYSVSLRRG